MPAVCQEGDAEKNPTGDAPALGELADWWRRVTVSKPRQEGKKSMTGAAMHLFRRVRESFLEVLIKSRTREVQGRSR